jgi:RNA polymerase sigma-70 factor (ECF subfamily)
MQTAQARPDSAYTLDLLGRAERGDRAAVELLLAEYRESMRRFIDLHLDPAIRGRVDPSDVVQDAQLTVAHRLHDYLARRPMPFHLWVRRTAYERMLNTRNRHRAARRDVKREVKPPDRSSVVLAESLIGSVATPSAIAQAKEFAERFAAVIAELPDADREILLLRQVEDMPYEEVAVLLDIEETTARQRYGRALVRLKRRLSKSGLLGDVE